MKKPLITSIAASLLLLAGTAQAGALSSALDGINKDSKKPTASSKAPRVPPSHMPPPGQCRIWYHGKAAGQQPAPGKCKKLRKKVPRGASLIRG